MLPDVPQAAGGAATGKSGATADWTEAERLAALATYDVLDSAPERAFDDIVALIAGITSAPISVVNLIAGDRQWFKAEVGLGVRETSLDVSICARVMMQPGLTVIPDLRQDPRFAHNPLITAQSGLRFYAGTAIITPAGLPLGTLCVLDRSPRPAGLTAAQASALEALARQVMHLLELRRRIAESRAAQAAHRDSEARLAAMFAQATVGLCEIDPAGRFIRLNLEFCRLLGRTEAALQAGTVFDVTVAEDVAISERAMQQVLAGGPPSRLEKRYRRPDGTVVWAEIGLTRLDDAEGRPRSILTVAVDLTERIAATDRLALSEETLRLATGAAEVGTWDLNLVTDELTWSGRTRAMFGITDARPVSMADFYAALHPDDLGRTTAAFLSTLDPASRLAYDVEYRTIGLEDGVTRWVAARGRGLFEDGRCVRAIGTAIDITARKQDDERLRRSEAMLADSEAKFRAITDSIDQMVWSNRPDGVDDFYNQRWYDYTGLPPGSTHGGAWRGLFHAEDEARAAAAWQTSLKSGAPYRAEYRLRHRTGQYRWVLARAQAVHDATGRVVRWYGTCTEIEEIVQARDVLARSRRELEREVTQRTAERDQVWRNVQDLLLVTTADGTVLSANPAWLTTLGWRPEELVGTRIASLVDPELAAASATAWADAMAGQHSSGEIRIRHRNGEYRTISWLLGYHDGRIYAGGRDITEQRQAAAALAATQEQLRQAQKMEAVGQLTGGIAHDFNNMLTVVIGSLDLLGRRLGPGATREHRYVDSALDGARRAALLTQRLLAFARQQPLQPAAVDVNALLDGMAELLRHSLGVAVSLELRLARSLWAVHVDPNQLENVILNLAVNGRDAMADKPSGADACLTIATENLLVGPGGAPAHPDLQPGEYVVVAVTDTGRGMTDAVAARAFDPFFTTKDVGHGTGLGLSQVYGFVTQSGGTVRLSSSAGHGTTVRICLPRLVAGVQAADPPTPKETVRAVTGTTVLVVEDDEAVRRFSVEALSTLGYRVLEANGAAAGLEMLDGADVTLLFTDVVMPDVNGRQLAEEAVRRHPGLKLLFTTGYSRDPSEGSDPRPSAPVLTKPFTVADLASKVRAVLDA